MAPGEYRTIASKRLLFPSKHKRGTVAIDRQTAHDILKDAFIEMGLNDKLAKRRIH